MSKVNTTSSASIIADLLVANATALNAKVAGLDAESGTDGQGAEPPWMSMSRLIRIRELSES